MSNKKNNFIRNVEEKLEISMFASRWFMAPVYVVLSISLAVIMVKVVQEFVNNIPGFISMDIKSLLLFVLHIIDMALIGNLVLMILFAGYENFVSKIGAARNSEDKPACSFYCSYIGYKFT